MDERRHIRQDVEIGRALVRFEDCLAGLEGKLGLKRRGSVEAEDEESEAGTSEEEDELDESEATEGRSVTRLTRRIEDFSRMVRLVDRVGDDHPFIQAQRPRVAKCRDVLLQELINCLKQLRANSQPDPDPDQKLQVLKLYREVKYGESHDEKIDWL